MHLVVFYDVPDDRIRRKIAITCEDYGLDRTQFSAFVGNLTRSQQAELMLKLRHVLGKADGALLLIPISPAEWAQRVEYRQNAPGDGIITHASTIADRERHDGILY
jgi:CRISPR-associated protein Cas2